MRFLVLWLGLLPAAAAASFTIHGTVLDPSGAAIAGAQVSAVNRLGVAQQTTTDQAGGFTLKLAGVFWEAGANPARPRHCKRGGPVEREPLS